MKLAYLGVLPLLLAMTGAMAAEVATPKVLPEAVARHLLANDPAIEALDSTLRAGQIGAEQQALSPYDWVARGTYQRRDYRGGTGNSTGASNEWNVGIERSVRLPGKVSADQASSAAASRLAQLQAQHARRQVVAELLDAWFDWQDADSRKALLLRQQIAVADNVAAVIKRVKGGDAAQLEQQLARAELATLQRQVSEASSLAASRWTLLTTRYPASAEIKPSSLPEPIALVQDASWWQARQQAANDAVALARAQVEVAAAEVQRAEAERHPDPTLGVFTASEAYGNERIIGVSASIPLGGKRRGLEVTRLQAAVDSARLHLALVEREQRAASLNRYHAATGAYERWQLAQQAAAIMADNARLTQKAYALGEGDIQLLLQARRQSLAALDDEASAKVAALRAYTELLLSARLLWPEWLNPTTL